MAPSTTTADLKRQLLAEVSSLFRHDGRLWKEPIVEMLQEFRDARLRAVVFGGTLRSLLTSRLFLDRPGRPRDVDVVVSGIPLREIEHRFKKSLTRHTRFGGLQLHRGGWQFDVWPVGETWALRKDGRPDAGFAALPSTTTFNLEAIAVDAWPRSGHSREMFSGDDQFFDGIRTQTLELNREDNPYPDLTVVRALVLAASLRFRIGPRLANYIASAGIDLEAGRFEDLQRGHYGHVRLQGSTLRALMLAVSEQRRTGESVELPATGQLSLWSGSSASPRLRVHWLGS